MPRKKSVKTPKKNTVRHSKKRPVGFGAAAGILLVGIFFLYLGFNNIQRNSVTSFEQCVEAGNPVMESYPRQCAMDGKTFVESIDYSSPQILQIKKGTNDIALDFPRGNYIINSQEQWNELFGATEISPEVDFDEKTVIAVVMGQKPSGGYSVSLKQVELQDGKIEFLLNESIPGENCFVTEALTNPYQIIAIEKTDKDISFMGNTVEESCQ